MDSQPKPQRLTPLARPARGLTLIEIIIGLTVVGVLAALALPSYQNYTRRAVVTEGMSLAQPHLLKVKEAVLYGELDPSNLKPLKPLNLPTIAMPGSRGGQPARQQPAPVVATAHSFLWNGLDVVINYPSSLDPSSTGFYSLVLAGSMGPDNASVTFTCVSGPEAQPYLTSFTNSGFVVGQAMPKQWAPSGC